MSRRLCLHVRAPSLQAPQRQRIARQRYGSAAAARIAACATDWRAALMAASGAPASMLTLLTILTPRVVWSHALATSSRAAQRAAIGATASRCPSSARPATAPCALHAPTGRTEPQPEVPRAKGIVEAAICRGGQFDGRAAAGHFAHGVYEGSYWQLLGAQPHASGLLSHREAKQIAHASSQLACCASPVLVAKALSSCHTVIPVASSRASLQLPARPPHVAARQQCASTAAGDVKVLHAALSRMAKPPPLAVVPPLALPPAPAPPPWEGFAPVLQAVPQAATLPELVLPLYEPPPLLVRFTADADVIAMFSLHDDAVFVIPPLQVRRQLATGTHVRKVSKL
jgi:hypothetical protein